MSIETDFLAYLQTKSAVTTLVGTRFYPGNFPSSLVQYPAIAYDVTGTRDLYTTSGVNGLRHTTIRFRIYGNLYSDLIAVTAALRDDPTINGYQGTMGSSWVDQLTVVDISDSRPIRKLVGSQDNRRPRTIVFGIWHT